MNKESIRGSEKNNLDKIADVVICDAGFIGKVELYKMTQLCLAVKIPYLLIKNNNSDNAPENISEEACLTYNNVPKLSKLLQDLAENKEKTTV